MDIDFHIAAPDEWTANKVAAAASELGYRTSIHWHDREDRENNADPRTCECTMRMEPTYDGVIAAQAELDGIARPLGAYCDGWGTFGNVDMPK
jgi:regulator of RNase E activity RraB